MRILRLDLPSGAVDLHPFVTVVRGLSPAARDALLGALEAAARGKATVPGLVEAYGVLLDLDAASLDLLDLVDDVDPVVRADDLPTAPAGARAAEADRAVADAELAAAAAAADVERAERAVGGARDALDAARAAATAGGPVRGEDPLARQRAELERCVVARAEAERAVVAAAAAQRAAAAAVRDADAGAEAARAARTDATRALADAAGALEAATDRRDPMAAAALEAARSALAAAEAAVVAARASDDDAAPVVAAAPPTPEEVAALRAERIETEAGILALETVDPSPVRLAVEQLRAGAAPELVADPRALDLAERWAAVEVDLRRVGAVDIDAAVLDGQDLAAARARLADAEAGVAAIEAGMRAPVLDPADARALDAAHLEVQEAREAHERRFGRGGAAKRLEVAEAAEAALLDKLGFTTYTDYLLGQRGAVDLAAAHRLDEVRRELALATRAVRELETAVAVELRRAELLDRRRALRAEVVALLGDDFDEGDVAGALRRRRVPATETGGHLARLRAALEATGLVLGDESLPERTLVDLAAVWLEEQERAATERARLEQRIGDLDARIAEATRNGVANAGPAGSATTPLAGALAAVDEARAAVAAAEARLDRHREAEADVAARRAAFEHAAALETAAVAAVAEAEAARVDSRASDRSAAVASAAAEAALAEARAAESAAAELLAELEVRLAGTAPEQVAALEADLASAAAGLHAARTAAARATADLDAARAARAAAAPGPDDGDEAGDPEDAEWFLLARLAAQRAVSYAGSVPLVLDDALSGFDAEPTRRLLDRLERMASTVQLVLVTEDLTTAAWAEALGPERAAVVEP